MSRRRPYAYLAVDLANSQVERKRITLRGVKRYNGEDSSESRSSGPFPRRRSRVEGRKSQLWSASYRIKLCQKSVSHQSLFTDASGSAARIVVIFDGVQILAILLSSKERSWTQG